MDWNTNTARKLDRDSQRVSQPRLRPQTKPGQQTVPFSKFECLYATACAVVIVMMMITLVSTKIGISAAQRKLQNVQTQISSVNNSNINQREEISNLTSQSHLKKTAVQYKFKDANSDVRNVNQWWNLNVILSER